MKKRGRERNSGISPSSKFKDAKEDSSFQILKIALNELKSEPKNVKEDSSFQILKIALKELKEKYNINLDELKGLLGEKQGIVLPISIFNNKNLSCLEIICKYLKEELNLKFSRIASILNRNQRTIWTTYHNAAKKQKTRLVIKESVIAIPAKIFSDRKFSVLELIVFYLKENYDLTFAEIASLLQKDQRNIWTTYSRFKKKKR